MRKWFFESYGLNETDLIMALDASPFGIGGIMIKNKVIVAYFSDRISQYDERLLGIKFGSDDAQQVCEALCVLVALRLWAQEWMHRRTILQIKTDNVGALTLASQLKGKKGRGIIAREIALIYSESCYEPRRLTHVPGVVNCVPDALSRLVDPSGNYTLPTQLANLTPTTTPRRDTGWYRTLQPRQGMRGSKRRGGFVK